MDRRAWPYPHTLGSPNTFTPARFVFSELRTWAKTVGAAVFVFNGDDTIWYRGELFQQPRDNVLIEYGLFSGSLEDGRTLICLNPSARIAVDLGGLLSIDISAKKRSYARIQFRTWLQRLTSRPLDPAILGLLADKKILEEELADAHATVQFQKQRAEDLETIVTRMKVRPIGADDER